MSTVGERIRGRRLRCGLSVVSLAADVGVSRNTLANWEAGRTAPTSVNLVLLAVHLGCTAADLLGEEGAAFRAGPGA